MSVLNEIRCKNILCRDFLKIQIGLTSIQIFLLYSYKRIKFIFIIYSFIFTL